jgi:tRNA A37 threonylcarbamoyltransferase TsaD
VILGGGVSANKRLRETLERETAERELALYLPGKGLSTDNALMIGVSAAFHEPLADLATLRARGNWRITEK